MTPERIAELRSWNTLSDRWMIWDSPEFKEYINDPKKHWALGVMDLDDPSFMGVINEFLDSHGDQEWDDFAAALMARGAELRPLQPVEDDTDWKAKYYALRLRTLEPTDDAYRELLAKHEELTAKYDELWSILREKAEDRQMYEEFMEFSDAHGGPDYTVDKGARAIVSFSAYRPIGEDSDAYYDSLPGDKLDEVFFDAVIAIIENYYAHTGKSSFTTTEIRKALDLGGIYVDEIKSGRVGP